MDDSKASGAPLTPSPSLSSPAPSSRPKHKRAPAGKGDCCRTCRLRKVRCSGNPGTGEACTNCSRLDLQCGFKDATTTTDVLHGIARTAPSNSHTEAGTVRKRAQKACAQCHAHKTRCSGDLPRCARCVASDLVCEYNSAKRRKTAAAASSAAASEDRRASASQPDEDLAISIEVQDKRESSTSQPPPVDLKPLKQDEDTCFVDMEELTRGQSLALKDILKQHFDVYLEHLFYLPCLSFLHPASTYRAIEEGTLPPPLGAALCAAISPLIKPCPVGEDFGARCIDQVELHIWRTMHTFSDDIFVLVALGMVYDFFTCAFAKAWQSIGVGLRLMLGLQANWETSPSSSTSTPTTPTSEAFVKQECTRRAAWFMFVFDRILAGGYDAYVSCRRETMKIRLPCDDQAFLEGQQKQAPRLDENLSKANGALGIAAYCVLMIDLRHRIENYTRTLACNLTTSNKPKSDPPSILMSDINDFQNSLSQMHSSLPARLRLSQKSIAAHMSASERSGFVFFHTHFFASHIDLYRFALPGFQQKNQRETLRRLPRDFIEKSQRQAVAHAISLARFCEDIMHETEKLSASDGEHSAARRMFGDVTIAQMATQGIRVLLVALQYGLHEGLDLAEHSTVPLWRLGTTTGPQIRQLVDSLIRISEPWAGVLVMSRHVHQQNVAMVEQFDKTHHFSDRRGTVNHTASTVEQGPAKLPGAHFLLDSIHLGEGAREQRIRAHDAAAQSWWTQRGSSLRRNSDEEPASDPTDVPKETAMGDFNAISEREAEAEAAAIAGSYAPPGVPMVLARARGGNFETNGLHPQVMDNNMQMMQQTAAMWPMQDLDALAPPNLTQAPHSVAAQMALIQQEQSTSGQGPPVWPPGMPGVGPFFASPGPMVSGGPQMFVGEEEYGGNPAATAPFAWPISF